jgi:hypothetical protein
VNAAELFGPDWISLWLTGVALVGLGVALFVLDVGNRAQRVFALILVLRGLTFFLGPLRFEADSASQSALWANLAPYTILPVVPLLVYFLSLYPRPRGLGKTRGRSLLLLAATGGILLWYLLDHSRYAMVSLTQPARYENLGPLFTFTGLRLPMLAAVGLVLAFEYRKAPRASAGFSMFLLIAAFTLNGLYDGVLAVLDLVEAHRDGIDIGAGWAWTSWWLPPLALAVALTTCAVLAPVLAMARTDTSLQEVTRFFVIAVPLALLTPFVRVLPYDAALDHATFIFGIWRLLIPFLIAYALMRYQLFDLDLRLKAGVRRGIIVGAFTITFFLVSEAAENLLQGDRGTLFGIVAAGVLALGSRPLKAFADRASDAFMPDTKPIAEQSYRERLAFYLEQYKLVNRDGHVTPKERRMLDRLRTTLWLPEDAVHDLEALQELPSDSELRKADADDVDQSGPEDSRLERVLKAGLATGTMALVFGMLSQGLETLLPLSDMASGLIAAAVVALLLGPLESLADRLTHRFNPKAATEARDVKQRRAAFKAALATALEDGSLSPRDLDYLDGLQKRLRITRAQRWQMERRAMARRPLSSTRRARPSKP